MQNSYTCNCTSLIQFYAHVYIPKNPDLNNTHIYTTEKDCEIKQLLKVYFKSVNEHKPFQYFFFTDPHTKKFVMEVYPIQLQPAHVVVKIFILILICETSQLICDLAINVKLKTFHLSKF